MTTSGFETGTSLRLRDGMASQAQRYCDWRRLADGGHWGFAQMVFRDYLGLQAALQTDWHKGVGN